LTTENDRIIVNKEENKTFSIFVNYKAIQKPNFIWYIDEHEIIFSDGNVIDDEEDYGMNITSSEVMLNVFRVDYHCFGNFTLNAKLFETSENITIELIVEGN
jgi:hypothetical protein